MTKWVKFGCKDGHHFFNFLYFFIISYQSTQRKQFRIVSLRKNVRERGRKSQREAQAPVPSKIPVALFIMHEAAPELNGSQCEPIQGALTSAHTEKGHSVARVAQYAGADTTRPWSGSHGDGSLWRVCYDPLYQYRGTHTLTHTHLHTHIHMVIGRNAVDDDSDSHPPPINAVLH